jgi:hypothetical protein
VFCFLSFITHIIFILLLLRLKITHIAFHCIQQSTVSREQEIGLAPVIKVIHIAHKQSLSRLLLPLITPAPFSRGETKSARVIRYAPIISFSHQQPVLFPREKLFRLFFQFSQRKASESGLFLPMIVWVNLRFLVQG